MITLQSSGFQLFCFRHSVEISTNFAASTVEPANFCIDCSKFFGSNLHWIIILKPNVKLKTVLKDTK